MVKRRENQFNWQAVSYGWFVTHFTLPSLQRVSMQAYSGTGIYGVCACIVTSPERRDRAQLFGTAKHRENATSPSRRSGEGREASLQRASRWRSSVGSGPFTLSPPRKLCRKLVFGVVAGPCRL